MNVLAVTLLPVIILAGCYYEVAATSQKCNVYSNTNCSSCVQKSRDGGHCYWCPSSGNKTTSGKCAKWDWADLPSCEGSKYYYRQCDVNGVAFIIIFSVGVFLILVAIVLCCVCCCCCVMRRRRRDRYERIRHVTEDPRDRQRYCQARRNEIRQQYGLDTAM